MTFTGQEERLEELRDTHRLETASLSDQVEKLRRQLSEAEAIITASQSTTSQTEEDNAKRDSDMEHLRAEVSKANEIAKEEEEKRVKAISLLKTVRQKVVKAEKERDDTLRELNETRGRDLEEKEKDRVERANLEREVDAANGEREKAVTGLRAQFDKDIAATKDRAEWDIQTAKKQFDAEMNSLKVMHFKVFKLSLLMVPDFILCGGFWQKIAYQQPREHGGQPRGRKQNILRTAGATTSRTRVFSVPCGVPAGPKHRTPVSTERIVRANRSTQR